MTIIKKLHAYPYDDAHVEILDKNHIYFFSEDFLVASIEEKWLTIYRLGSTTTYHHLSAFMNEYTTCSYSTAKAIYLDNLKMNIETGEVTEIGE